MKKLLTLLFALIVIAGYSQETEKIGSVGRSVGRGADSKNINRSINHTNYLIENPSSSDTLYNDTRVTINAAQLQDSLGRYIITSPRNGVPGAISGDDLEDQSAIQTAIQAVEDNRSATGPQGGTVYIPAGNWYITSGVKLRSWVHIEIDEGARFTFPEFYAGSMWTTDTVDTTDPTPTRNGYIQHASVRGGTYGTYERYRHWNFIDIRANDSDSSRMYSCVFENMFVDNPGIGINVEITNDGWVHTNTFRNIRIQRPRIGIRTRGGTAGTGFEDNIFDNVTIQTEGDSTEVCIDTLEQGRDNQFRNLRLYDISGSTVAGGLGDDFDYSIFLGVNPTYSTGWFDNGTDNIYIGRPRPGIRSLNITAADGIDTDDWLNEWVYDHHYVIRAANTSPVDISANPQLETEGVDSGQILTIFGSSDINTLTLNNANSLRLTGGASMTLGNIDNITFMYSSSHGYWLEIARMEF